MVTIHATYVGDLSTTAVHGPSGARIQTDAPKDNEGQGRYFSPTDLVGTALGTCMLTVMGIVARRNGIEMKGATVRVDKAMQSNPRRIASLTVAISMPGKFTDEQKKLLERTAHTCPVHQSLHPDLQMPITFAYPDC